VGPDARALTDDSHEHPPARRDDFPAIARFGLTYAADRVLAVERSRSDPPLYLRLRWQPRPGAPPAAYATYTAEWLGRALARAPLFLIAESDSIPVAMLIARVYDWTDAAEITDLAVDTSARRIGAGTALVDAACGWARAQGRRAVWVEPRADNAAAIEFYLALDFRIAGASNHASPAPEQAVIFMRRELG